MNLGKLWILLLSVVFVFTVSCESDDPVLEDEEVTNIESDVQMDAAFGDADELAGVSMVLAEGGSIGGRTTETDDRFACAEVSHNADLKQIIINFGEGCDDLRGHTRKGAIIITYTGPRFIPGSVITVRFEDYYYNGVKIEGVRTLTNITEGQDSPPKFQIVLVGGKLTFPDGTFVTREMTETRTWIRGANVLLDEFHVDGFASGVGRRGQEYSMEITQTLVWKVSCVLERVFLPVEGQKRIVRGTRVFEVDFGDGTCDNIFIVTSNGATATVDLSRD